MNWLLEVRNNEGMTQAEVAEKSGISRAYYTQIELGERGRKLPVATAKKIAAVLGFDWRLFYENQVKTG